MSSAPPGRTGQGGRPPREKPSPLERGWPVAWVLAWRYLRGERSQVLSSTALAALVATGLGVMAMVIAMALMSGYTDNLRRKLLGLQGDVIASPILAADLDAALERLEATQLDGVAFVGQVAYGEGSVSSEGVPEGVSVVLRGVDPGSAPPLLGVDGLPDPSGSPVSLGRRDGVSGVFLGRELQAELGVAVGHRLRLVVLSLGEDRARFRYRNVEVRGACTTGFAEFDSSWVLLDRHLLQEARGPAGIDILELKLLPGVDRDRVTGQIEAVLGSEWIVQRWETLNRQLFAALELQEALLFLVLGLIVVVSTFNTSSTLVILVRERLADIGVLGSLGLEPRKLWLVFVTYGMGLGAVGTFVGVGAGSLVAWVITEFELVRFDPEVAAIYFIDSVPFQVQAADVLAIVGFSLAVTFLACALPASRAARLTPAVAARDE